MSSSCILIVEDDDLLREVVVEALQETRYTVLSACNGPQALAMIDAHAEIDVIFSDVSMPQGVSGIDLAYTLRALKPNLRFILASGYAKSQLPPMPEGVLFLPKPYRVMQLLALLDAQEAD